MVAAEAKPERAATSSRGAAVVSRIRWARRMRSVSSHSLGDRPRAAWKRRARVRVLRQARRARSSTRDALVEVVGGPSEEVGEGLVGGVHGERAVDVLGLAALAEGGCDQAAGDRVGDLRSVVQADQVQAEVDAGGGAGRGEDVAVLDVEGGRVDLGRCSGPAGGRRTSSGWWPGGRRAGRRRPARRRRCTARRSGRRPGGRRSAPPPARPRAAPPGRTSRGRSPCPPAGGRRGRAGSTAGTRSRW